MKLIGAKRSTTCPLFFYLFSVPPLCSLCLCGDSDNGAFTTETQRTERLHGEDHLSISPSTISSVPIIATTSATRCPRQSFFKAWRLINDGGRTRTRHGCAVPSETR